MTPDVIQSLDKLLIALDQSPIRYLDDLHPRITPQTFILSRDLHRIAKRYTDLRIRLLQMLEADRFSHASPSPPSLIYRQSFLDLPALVPDIIAQIAREQPLVDELLAKVEAGSSLAELLDGMKSQAQLDLKTLQTHAENPAAQPSIG